MSDRDPITGPIPVSIDITPTAVVLDMTALTQLVVADVVEALLDPSSTELWDRLHELADTERTPVEGRLLTEELVGDLAERSSSRVPLYGHAARVLAERLLRMSGPRPVPSQREAGAA
ncbi:hypothetical protein ACFVDT_07195 [Streptomyces sp. NPDC057699]|uniref:hypothetical protein n=1 Tax=Streptomyces sp. NPDC057699 TaxID=3346220 RepID=UPI00367C1884